MEEILTYIKQNKLILIVMLLITVAGSGYFLTHQTAQPVKNELKSDNNNKVTKKVTPKETKETKSAILAVDVQGAVKNAGVYRVKTGAIVQEVLQMAGGLQSNADIKQINQAQRVTDQMQIYVPINGETPVTSQATSGGKAKGKVNINTAKVDDFKDVTGIGPKKAAKIIAFREKNGNFQELHDLTKVSGIGEKSLDSLKDQLTV